MCVCACVSHRLPEWQEDLSSENMEVVSRRRAVDHDPVAVVELTHGKVLSDVLREGWEGGETGSGLTFESAQPPSSHGFISHQFV